MRSGEINVNGLVLNLMCIFCVCVCVWGASLLACFFFKTRLWDKSFQILACFEKIFLAENMPLGLVAHTGLAGTFIYIYREREKERLRSIFGTTFVTPN